MRARLLLLVPALAACVYALQPAPTQARARQVTGSQEVREKYKKIEYRIPMRDGVKLYCAVYVPKDADGHSPIMLERTPYSAGPYGDTMRGGFRGSHKFIENNYIFAYEDVRGRFMSEGYFVDVRPEDGGKYHPNDIDESTDTYDTIDFLVKNVPGNNGKVGMWGISYPGFYTACGGIDSHPALKAISPQAPVSEWFKGDDFHHNGAFFMEDAFDFYLFFGLPRTGPTPNYQSVGPAIDRGNSGAYDFFLKNMPLQNLTDKFMSPGFEFWHQLMDHGSYDDFWQRRSLEPHLKNVHCAVMTVGGFFDAEDMYGALHVFKAIQKLNPGIENTIVMGPWFHGGWAGGTGRTFGDIDFGSDVSIDYRDNVEFPFFDYHLRGGPKPDRPTALMFETGSNKWVSFSEWPPKINRKDLYFESNKGLDWSKPADQDPNSGDDYASDPAKPVMFTEKPLGRRPREYMIADQRFDDNNPGVLSFETQPLSADLTVAGPLKANLFVTTTGTDADFVVKLIDVMPAAQPDNKIFGNMVKMGDYEMLVRAEIMRGKFRDSYSNPKPFVPGQITPVNFELNDTCHTFKTGHRIMVQIQSSWFPLVDLNPNKFVDIYHATPADFQKATLRLIHSAKYPSHIDLGLLTQHG